MQLNFKLKNKRDFMIHKYGEKITRITLPAIDNSTFDTESLKGKRFMLSFFRFASCPFCNLRVNELVQRFDEFGNNFTVVAIFDSPLDNLIRHVKGHNAPFPILADENNQYYQKYSIQHSVSGMFKGMVFRMPKLMKAMFKGYLPIKIKGSWTTMPAEFLIDQSGVIQLAHYGKDEGDHLPFEQVKAFSLK